MAEEGSVSPRPRGFTPYHSFIINLHHLGFSELGIPQQTRALFSSICCSATWEVLALLGGKRERFHVAKDKHVVIMYLTEEQERQSH